MAQRHSVTLMQEKCIGCTDCIKRCPTEAIRVRNAKAYILDNRCIDCGTCIAVCKQHAKKATTDPLESINGFRYKVAIPAPTLYGQFRRTQDVNTILTALKRLGFDDVFEVSRAAELITAYSKTYIAQHKLKRPIISSACPATVRLIMSRFPELIEHILPVIAPIEAAAQCAKKYLIEEKGIPPEDIGVFFISPCGAKATIVREPVGIEKSAVDGVISIKDIYIPLRGIIKTISDPQPLAQARHGGINWAISGGEARGLKIENAISVDGVENVIKVLEELEDDQLVDVDFIEPLACIGGCIGGPLAIKNSFVAKNILEKEERNTEAYTDEQTRQISYPSADLNLLYTKDIEPYEMVQLDQDIGTAILKMEKIRSLHAQLPHIDCGSCGAPTCQAFAEDIVMENANTEDCIFMLRQKVRELAESMVSLSEKLPPSLANTNTNQND